MYDRSLQKLGNQLDQAVTNYSSCPLVYRSICSEEMQRLGLHRGQYRAMKLAFQAVGRSCRQEMTLSFVPVSLPKVGGIHRPIFLKFR